MFKTIIHYVLLLVAALGLVQIINNSKASEFSVKKKPSVGYWPQIDSVKLEQNLREHNEQALRLYQGRGTNFCGFAAITYYLIKHEPESYNRMVNELYRTGKTITPSGKVLEPSAPIIKYAGALQGNGRLDINHADQLWFLTLADQYKGYVNLFNWSYDYGDESTTWASTNLRKFNTMWGSLTGKEVHSKGADLVRPAIDTYYTYLKELQKEYSIMLYLNNTILNKRNFSSITFPIPTHFVELYDIYPRGEYYVLEYWDYGLKTKEIIRKEVLEEIIFGVSYVKKK